MLHLVCGVNDLMNPANRFPELAVMRLRVHFAYSRKPLDIELSALVNDAVSRVRQMGEPNAEHRPTSHAPIADISARQKYF
jgi:hypothetical protein